MNDACVKALVNEEDATDLISMAKLHVGRVSRQVAEGTLPTQVGQKVVTITYRCGE